MPASQGHRRLEAAGHNTSTGGAKLSPTGLAALTASVMKQTQFFLFLLLLLGRRADVLYCPDDS